MTRSQLAAEAESDETSKSPFTYALHVVFTSFVRIAEKKIGSVLGPSPEAEPDINAILGHGVDPAFDKILTNLGYIARRNPKPVIDSVMFWRKSRSELKSETNPSMPLGGHSDFMSGTLDSPVLQRRPTDLTRPSYIRSPSSFVNHNVQSTAAISRDAAILSERRSLVSIYILCRALIEIVKQISGNSLGSDVAEKLEEIVFNQLKNADPESLQASPLRNANWNLFAELLGSLSTIRFASVSDRFIADLERFERGPVSKEWEARVEMIISGMRHLRIRIYPAACLEESAEFLSSVAGFFVAAHGFKIKQAYAEVLYHLMLPIPDVSVYLFCSKIVCADHDGPQQLRSIFLFGLRWYNLSIQKLQKCWKRPDTGRLHSHSSQPCYLSLLVRSSWINGIHWWSTIMVNSRSVLFVTSSYRTWLGSSG